MSNTTWVGELTELSLDVFKAVCGLQSQMVEDFSDKCTAWRLECQPGVSAFPPNVKVIVPTEDYCTTLSLVANTPLVSANDNSIVARCGEDSDDGA